MAPGEPSGLCSGLGPAATASCPTSAMRPGWGAQGRGFGGVSPPCLRSLKIRRFRGGHRTPGEGSAGPQAVPHLFRGSCWDPGSAFLSHLLASLMGAGRRSPQEGTHPGTCLPLPGHGGAAGSHPAWSPAEGDACCALRKFSRSGPSADRPRPPAGGRAAGSGAGRAPESRVREKPDQLKGRACGAARQPLLPL